MVKSMTHTYHVGGMSCGGCATTVKDKLSLVKGVSSVSVNLGKKQAEISSSESINAETLQSALNDTHYTITELRA